MIEVGEATERIISCVGEGTVERRPILDSVGGFSASAILASTPLPGFDQSAFDGYALGRGPLEVGQRFSLVGEVQAGDSGHPRLEEFEAVRIFTGAEVPRGAVAVAMQEIVGRSGDGNEIRLEQEIGAGEGIRLQGSALCEGQRVIGRGDRITAAAAGILASQGHADIEVGSPPKVAIISTGNELVAVGQPLGDGQIYNSNGVMVEALCRRQGVSDVQRIHSRDDLAETRRSIRLAASGTDVIIAIGGVSVGDYDFVKPALAAEGFEVDYWRVRMKPGKPFLFGRRDADRKVFMGLPGNPVSAFVTFALFVEPLIKRWCGASQISCQPTSVDVEMARDITNSGDRPHFLMGEIAGKFFPAGLQESHSLQSAVACNALVRVEPGSTVSSGDRVSAILLA